MFHITKDNVFILPYAFESSGVGDMVVNKPSREFAMKIEPLRQKIIQRALYANDKEVVNYKLNEWFEFANNFWSFTETFKGITEYNTLD